MSNIEKVLISEKEIKDKVKSLGEQISKDYVNNDKDLICVCILKGSAIFLSDLVREIQRPVKIDFISISNYEEDKKTENTKSVKLIMDTRLDLENKDVIIVEDIVNTGETTRYLVELIKSKNPSSVKVCSLLIKNNKKNESIVDYYGFNIETKLTVVGYGLDFKEESRNIPFIGVLYK